jgi:hypothetical protein
MSGFNKNFKGGDGGLRAGSGASTFESSDHRAGAGGGSNSNPPVAFWDMEEGGSGTTVTDRSDAGNSLDLTIRDTGGALPTWDTGDKLRGTYSLKIAGNNDQAYIADNAKLDFAANAAFSLSMWVKKIDLDDTDTVTYLAKMANSSPYRGYEVGAVAGGVIKFLFVDTYSSAALAVKTSTTHMSSNSNWNHIVVTYDGSAEDNGVTIYHNAVGKTLDSTSNALATMIADTLETDDTTINSDIFTLGSRATGLHAGVFMDDVAVFDYELTAAQVTSIYNSGAGLDVSAGIPG